MARAGVGIIAVVLTPGPRIGAGLVELTVRRLISGIGMIGTKAVLSVLDGVSPDIVSMPDARPLSGSREIDAAMGTAVFGGDLVAEVGMLLGILCRLDVSEDKVAGVLSPAKALSLRTKTPRCCDLVPAVVKLAPFELLALLNSVLKEIEEPAIEGIVEAEPLMVDGQEGDIVRPLSINSVVEARTDEDVKILGKLLKAMPKLEPKTSRPSVKVVAK